MTEKKEKSLVVIQLSGGNDAMNTIVPYTNGIYHDSRSAIHLTESDVIDINGSLGFHPEMGEIKKLWDSNNVAVINGIGYPVPNRSHFRSMDIWHTAESESIAPDGWLGRTIREIDPSHNNVVTAVNFGRGLPRALVCKDVPVASVGDLETYGLMPDIQGKDQRENALNYFSRMYGPNQGRDAILDALSENGVSAMIGADILSGANSKYSSSVEYADNPIANNLKDIAKVIFADIGTKIYYAQHGSFDTHAGELFNHAKLWKELSDAIGDFYRDLKEHGRENDVTVLLFSEFGRRIEDNGSGTDHGSGGIAFVLGGSVKGGLYGEQPSLEISEQIEGDMKYNNDFRSTYATLLDQWLGIDSVPILGKNFEQFSFIKKG